VRAVDTNVVARLLLSDDPQQAADAISILREQVWVGLTIWLELGWVLASRTSLDRATVAEALASLLAFDTVHTEDREGLAWAIARFREGADWADMVHLVACRRAAGTFATFDRGIEPAAGPTSPLPIETLA